MRITTLALLVAALFFVVAFGAGCKKKGAEVNEAKARQRCAKWSKLLRMPKDEKIETCLKGMRKLAGENPEAYRCGNGCIDGAKDGRALIRCMARCKKP